MEKFRLKQMRNIRISGIIMPLILLLFIALNFFVKDVERPSEFASGFHDGVRLGLFLVFEAYWLFSLTRSIRVLRNKEYLRKLYIKETDERLQYVKMKSGANFIKVFALILMTAILISSFFNSTVFLTLIGVAYATAILKLILILYYRKKY